MEVVNGEDMETKKKKKKKKKGNVVRKRKRKNSFKNLPKPMKVRIVTDNADSTPDGQQVQQSTSGDQ